MKKQSVVKKFLYSQKVAPYVCVFTLPRIGTVSDGIASIDVVGVVCWMREVPKGSAFRYVAGIQLRFADMDERRKMQDYVAGVKKRYRL